MTNFIERGEVVNAIYHARELFDHVYGILHNPAFDDVLGGRDRDSLVRFIDPENYGDLSYALDQILERLKECS